VLIDWFTVAAQIFNFLVLVALLKYFLFDRIVKVMAERERNIATRLEEADAIKERAQKEERDYRALQDDLKQTRRQMLVQAKEDAESLRNELLEKARVEIDSIKSKWQESAQREQGAFLSELKKIVEQETIAISRQALAELADYDLEEAILKVFSRHFREVPPDQLDKLRQDFGETSRRIIVRSSFELSQLSHDRLVSMIQEALDQNCDVNFEVSQNLVCGVEVIISGFKIGWNINQYIEKLQAVVTQSSLKELQRPLTEKNADSPELRQTKRSVSEDVGTIVDAG